MTRPAKDPNNFAPMLRRAGLRPTRQRLALARLLFAAGDRHVSAEQLFEEAARAGLKVSQATVYNTLHHFTRAGLLREVVVDAGRYYFDTNTRHHQHFYLEEGAVLVDILGDRIRVEDLPEPPAGTAVDRVDVVVRLKGRPRD
ncbi:MAG: transcriptional repressor [Alphaproteobacteria bacterium]|nr:transcriptional repressor [Alphaproteobacteria bacterium]